jgi:hypothetical protein
VFAQSRNGSVEILDLYDILAKTSRAERSTHRMRCLQLNH